MHLVKKNLLAPILSLFMGGLILSPVVAQTTASDAGAYRSGLSEEAIKAARPKTNTWSFRSERPELVITDTLLLSSGTGGGDGILPSYGFVPVELEIRNLKNIPRELVFSLSGSETVIPLVVPARDSIRETVYFPISPLTSTSSGYGYGSNLSVTDGKGTHGMGSSLRQMGSPAVIAGGGLNFLHRDALAASGSHTFIPLFFQDLPADWRFYSSLDAIVLEHAEFQSLDRARQIKILEWAAHGGHLILNHFDASKSDLTAGSYFQGKIHFVDINTADQKAMQAFYMDMQKKYKRNLNFASNELSPASEEYSLRLPSVTALFILAFVIIVGPVNLWIFAPVGKRQRLFWTTPVITVSSGILLFIFILFVDGFGGAGKRLVYVDLFPPGNSAWITQSQVSRSGILTETNFVLPDDILFNSRELSEGNSWTEANYDIYNSRGSRYANVASGYFASRSARWQNISANVLNRGELNMVDRDSNGAPILLSSLPSRLTDFRYTDEEGKNWIAHEIRPGQKTTLKPSTATGSLAAKQRLNKGMFHAKGDASELAPVDTLPSIKWNDTVIYRGQVVKK